MKILTLDEVSIAYRMENTDVSTPESDRFVPKTTLGTLRVEFSTVIGDQAHTSVSNVITALRKYIDEQPLP